MGHPKKGALFEGYPEISVFIGSELIALFWRNILIHPLCLHRFKRYMQRPQFYELKVHPFRIKISTMPFLQAYVAFVVISYLVERAILLVLLNRPRRLISSELHMVMP